MKKPRIFHKGGYWYCDFYLPKLVRGWGFTPRGAYDNADMKVFLKDVERMTRK